MRRPADANLLRGAMEAKHILASMGITLPVAVRYGRVPKNLVGTGSSIHKTEKTWMLTVTIRDNIETVCGRFDIDPKTVPAIICDTVFHEVGHVLLEHVRGEIFLPGMKYTGEPVDISGSYDPWDTADEERFSEDFVRFCRRNTDERASAVFAKCVRNLAADLDSPVSKRVHDPKTS